MRAKLTFQRFKYRPLINCNGNQMFSEGNRIIVIKMFFATPFSDLFRLQFNNENLLIDLYVNITFQQRKQLLHERIRDHIMQMLKL